MAGDVILKIGNITIPVAIVLASAYVFVNQEAKIALGYTFIMFFGFLIYVLMIYALEDIFRHR